MGKVRGFLEHERGKVEKRPVAERVRDYHEFELPIEDAELKTQASRCMDCGIPFCHNGCPVNNLIPDWNELVRRGRWQAALDVLHSTNNFPEFTGRICPAPCEASCTLNIDDNPVTIKSIECSIVDRGWEEGWIQPYVPSKKTGKRIAVELGGIEERRTREVARIVEQKGLKAPTVMTFNNFAQAFQALRAGQAEAATCIDSTAMYMQSQGDFTRAISGVFPQTACFAFANKTLAQAVIGTLNDLKKDGYYDQQLDKYGVLKVDSFVIAPPGGPA